MQKNYALPAWFAGPLFYGDDTYLRVVNDAAVR